LADCYCLFHHFIKREFLPMKRIIIETINGEKAVRSPYLASFKREFDLTVDRDSISLYRRRE
jgi:hypothetical protein